ncbi:MAG TPA: hypothetical protein VJR28_05530 [Chthoniobacterales bacterium]|nr:hypothetical protein [Chthoniobacterales bacterium]
MAQIDFCDRDRKAQACNVEKASRLLGGFSETELERPRIAAYYAVIWLAAVMSRGRRNFLIWKQKRIYYRLVEKAQLTIARR